MLDELFQQKTDQAVASRFQLRDETLKKDLDDLVARTGSYADPQEREKLGVKLRLICERDLYERARMVWMSVKRAHEDGSGKKSSSLIEELLSEVQRHMKPASIHLANELASRSEELGPAFCGFGQLNADWVAKLRGRSVERVAKDIDEYVSKLKRGIGHFRN